jgi:hypothetical protein
MAGKEAQVAYAAAYETVEAALADLDTIEQLHKNELIGEYRRVRRGVVRSGRRQARRGPARWNAPHIHSTRRLRVRPESSSVL